MTSSTTHLRRVELVTPDPEWAKAYNLAARDLADLVGDNVSAMHHVGSTSIPNIKAKPVIDILIEVKQLSEVDALNPGFKSLGYEPLGEYGVPGRRFFTRNVDGKRTHNIHVFQVGHLEIDQMLTFRDYLRHHPDEAQAYEQLKLELAQKFPLNVNAYAKAKTEFVSRILYAGWAEREAEESNQ